MNCEDKCFIMSQLLYESTGRWINLQVQNLVLPVWTHGMIFGARNSLSGGVEWRHLATKPCKITNIGIHDTTEIGRDIFGENFRGDCNLIQVPCTITHGDRELYMCISQLVLSLRRILNLKHLSQIWELVAIGRKGATHWRQTLRLYVGCGHGEWHVTLKFQNMWFTASTFQTTLHIFYDTGNPRTCTENRY